jgi:RNA 3'-terminal phosphate cyclase (ATP)
MLEVDGSAGGGQLLRSSLALAAVTDQAVTVANVRGSRPEPGLKPQHLSAVEVLSEVCDGAVEGASLGSETVTFEPGEPRGGHVEASIGTAGSLTLVFDTLLPLGVVLDEPLSVTVGGGTAVKWSPPLSTYRRVKLPLLRDLGLSAAVDCHRPGYYPEGGGKATLHLGPSSLSSLSLAKRGERLGARVVAQTSQDLADDKVARRLAETATKQLSDADIDVLETSVRTKAAVSTGASLTVELVYEHSRAGFDALGEPGKPAETVTTDAVEQALAFDEGSAAVDRHLADQLLAVLALAGGRLAIPERTDHVETSLDLLDTFGVDCRVKATEDESYIVERQ